MKHDFHQPTFGPGIRHFVVFKCGFQTNMALDKTACQLGWRWQAKPNYILSDENHIKMQQLQQRTYQAAAQWHTLPKLGSKGLRWLPSSWAGDADDVVADFWVCIYRAVAAKRKANFNRVVFVRINNAFHTHCSQSLWRGSLCIHGYNADYERQGLECLRHKLHGGHYPGCLEVITQAA